MRWQQLMSSKRYRGEGHPAAEDPVGPDERSPFVKDSDRIVFCKQFRRLQDKTQVHPAPRMDVVRTRLTHSLEASSVGRSLGIAVGKKVLAGPEAADLKGLEPGDFGGVVAAACLAHDIGNAPFGHAGEDAIQHWFGDPPDAEVMEELSIQQKADFLCFEGNAQGFRVVTRLEGLPNDGGLRLTCATLGTFLKYPLPSVDASGVPRKKFGFFHADESAVRTVATEVGLEELPGTGGYARHPLAYLVEAADDICYLIADLEDGIETQILRPDEAEPLLTALVPPAELRTYSRLSDTTNRIGYLRAKAIGCLIEQAVEVFASDHDAILGGRRDMKAALLDDVGARDTIKEIKVISRERLYDLPRNLEAEVAGYEVVHGLLAIFVEALMAKTRAGATAKAAPKHELTYKLLGTPNVADRYRWLLGVTDRIAIMTDTDAIELYRRLKGITMGAAPLRLR